MTACVMLVSALENGNTAPWRGSPSNVFDPAPVPLIDVLSELSYNRDLRHPDSPSPKHPFGAGCFPDGQQPLGSRARVRAEARAEARAENVALHSTALTPYAPPHPEHAHARQCRL